MSVWIYSEPVFRTKSFSELLELQFGRKLYTKTHSFHLLFSFILYSLQDVNSLQVENHWLSVRYVIRIYRYWCLDQLIIGELCSELCRVIIKKNSFSSHKIGFVFHQLQLLYRHSPPTGPTRRDLLRLLIYSSSELASFITSSPAGSISRGVWLFVSQSGRGWVFARDEQCGCISAMILLRVKVSDLVFVHTASERASEKET